MDSFWTPLLYVAVSFLVFLLVFLILREVTCWYFKLSKIVELLESNGAELRKVNQNLNALMDGAEKYMNTTLNKSS